MVKEYRKRKRKRKNVLGCLDIYIESGCLLFVLLPKIISGAASFIIALVVSPKENDQTNLNLGRAHASSASYEDGRNEIREGRARTGTPLYPRGEKGERKRWGW